MNETQREAGERSRKFVTLAVATILSGLIAGLIVNLLVYGAITVNDWAHFQHSKLFLDIDVLLRMGFFVGTVFGIPSMLLFGLPIHWLLTSLARVSRTSYLLAGGVCGLVMSVLVTPHASSVLHVPALPAVLATGMGGPIAAYIFWLIRRPDRDEPPAHLPQPPAV